MSPRWTGSPRSSRASASSSSAMKARTGGTARKRFRPPPDARQRGEADVRVAGDVPERDDQIHVRMVERRPEREVAHPTAVGRDPVPDRERQDEGADRRRGEHRLRENLGRRLVRRVRELVRVRALRDRPRPRRRWRRSRPPPAPWQVARPSSSGSSKRSATVAGSAYSCRPFSGSRQRLCGRKMSPGWRLEHELLELVQQVERRHRPGQCPRGRAVDSPDSRPQRTDAQALAGSRAREARRSSPHRRARSRRPARSYPPSWSCQLDRAPPPSV